MVVNAPSLRAMRVRQSVRDYLSLSRAVLAAPNAFPFLIGGLIGSANLVELFFVFLYGCLFYMYSCKVNDLTDLERDSLHPRRRTTSPLVAGHVTQARVLHWTLIELLILTAALSFAPISLISKALYFGLLVLTTYGNVYQKTSRRVSPIVMDLLFGVLLSVPIAATALAFDAEPPVGLLLLCVAFGLQAILLNVFSGNLKDLEFDQLVKWRTSALALGVRQREDNYFEFPASYRGLVLTIQLGSVLATAALAAVVLTSPASTNPTGVDIALGVGSIAFAGLGAVLLQRRLSPSEVFLRKVRSLDRTSRQYTRVISRAGFLYCNFISFLLGSCLLVNDARTVLIACGLVVLLPALPLLTVGRSVGAKALVSE